VRVATGTAALLLATLVAGCGTSPRASESGAAETTSARPGRGATVFGTAIEAATGLPLAGVRVEGPGGATATTDASGRFELRGLAPGAAGLLRATTEAGLGGENRLRPLDEGRLEVVIFLRPSR
jgi:hypothetical protein